MINFKLLKNIISVLTVCFYCSTLKANPTGHELTLNIVNSKFNSTLNNSDFSDDSFSYGIDYKYHLNIGSGFFVAVGGFYDDLNLEDSSTTNNPLGNINTIVSVNKLYGVSFDIGYDYSKELTSFIGLTYNNANATSNTTFIGNSISNKASGNDIGFAVGGKYNFDNNYSAIISYNRITNNTRGVEFKIETIKLGLSYNF
tara:strand:+ start:50 stop:649 length:600 start_codon:yes stop_codon:yes gene_type:complete